MPRTQEEVNDLIQELVLGKDNAWNQFFSEFHPRFEGYCQRKASNLDTEDILSQFYLKLMEDNYIRLQNYSYGGEKGLFNYLLTILQNIIEAESKKRHYLKKDITEEKWASLEATNSVFLPDEEEIIPGLREKDFLSTIMKLEVNPRTSIYFLYRGYTNQEIANMMNVPLNTVLSWNSRSKKKLKKLLENIRGVQ